MEKDFNEAKREVFEIKIKDTKIKKILLRKG
jgi:hypothetical protein